MSKSFSVSGVDLSGFVTDWASIEEIKEVLLAKSTLFAGQMSLRLDNSDGRFSTEKAGSLFKGRSLYNLRCEVIVDEKLAFAGFLKDVQQNHQTRIASFNMENIFSKPAETQIILTQNGVNPVSGMLAILEQASLDDLIDRQSFLSASGPSLQAGAVVNLNFEDGANKSVLSSLQSLSELASVSVFVREGLIRAQAFRAYQGDSAGLGPEIGAAQAKMFGDLRRTPENFSNRVLVKYGNAGLAFDRTDQNSAQRNSVTRPFQFSTDTDNEIGVPDAASAEFFGNLFLSRASLPPLVGNVIVGREFAQFGIGDRLPITSTHWGLNQAPFEIIESHDRIQEDAVEFMLKGL